MELLLFLAGWYAVGWLGCVIVGVHWMKDGLWIDPSDYALAALLSFFGPLAFGGAVLHVFASRAGRT